MSDFLSILYLPGHPVDCALGLTYSRTMPTVRLPQASLNYLNYLLVMPYFDKETEKNMMQNLLIARDIKQRISINRNYYC